MFEHAFSSPHHLGRAGEIEGALVVIGNEFANHTGVYSARQALPVARKSFGVGQGVEDANAQLLRLAQDIFVGDFVRRSVGIEEDDVARLVHVDEVFQHASEGRDADAARDEDQFFLHIAGKREISGDLAREQARGGCAIIQAREGLLESAALRVEADSQAQMFLGRR